MNIFEQLISPITGLLSEVIPDTDERNRLAHEIATMASKQGHEIALQQIELNKLDAKGTWFQSSWRPALMWIGIATILANGLGNWTLGIFGLPTYHIPDEMVYTILVSSLGIGGMRSFDKLKKIDTK